MNRELDSDDSDLERSPSCDRKKYKVRSQLNGGYNNQKNKRDIIDSMLTYVNRDLLLCKLFYFFFFAAFGSLFPLLAIYFKQLGMNPTQSGILIGFRPFVEFCSAPFWGSIADRYKRGKELLLFSLFSWIIFTLAIAFVKPPAHHCVQSNITHLLPKGYVIRGRRDTAFRHAQFSDLRQNNFNLPQFESMVNLRYKREKEQFQNNPKSKTKPTASPTAQSVKYKSGNPTVKSEPNISKLGQITLSSVNIRTLAGTTAKPDVSTQSITGNENNENSDDYIRPKYSTIYYEKDAVQDTFFTLLLLIVIGEFFSAPAITFVDSVTLAYLGEDMDNYGRQRMFGSLGWGLSMFFVGLALDHSSTYPNHPCGIQHISEKNYIICFAVFSVLMSCALVTATQLKFDHRHGGGKDIQLIEFVGKVKDKMIEVITGEKKPDRGRLFNDEDDDIGYLESKASETNFEKTAKSAEENSQETSAIAVDNTNGAMTETGKGNGRNLQISLEQRDDMVADAVKNSGYTKIRPDDDEDEPFLGKWFSVLKMLATFRYISVLFISWFMGFGIGLIFTFLFWHLQDLSGSPTLFGIASVFNHVSELLAYFLSRKIMEKFGHIKVLYAGLLGNVIRFLYISWLKNPWWVLPFEFVQGLTHAAVWAACCSYITQAIPIGLRSTAQGILQGLHHGLGRGCGAVFGGIMVYSYGSEVTFRAYGVTCLVVLILYVALRYFLEDRGAFTHGGKDPHQLLEEESPTCHLAPHGVPSGIARDLSSQKLREEGQSNYGSTGGYGSQANTNDFLENLNAGQERLMMEQQPAMKTQIYQQQPFSNQDQYRP